MTPADLIRLMTLDGQVLGVGMLVALVWVVFTVRNLDSKVTGLDWKVASPAADVAFLRGVQAEQDRQIGCRSAWTGGSRAVMMDSTSRLRIAIDGNTVDVDLTTQ